MTPPRRRNPGNGDLPPNLYPNGKYFQYRNPETGRITSMNVPRDQAIDKAKRANALIASRKIDQLVTKMSGAQAGIRMEKVIEEFDRAGLPRLELATSTIREHRIKLRKYVTDFGERPYSLCDLEFWNAYLSQFPPAGNSYVKHRGLLIHLYRYAISMGWERNTVNVPELTLKGMKQKKKRQPITGDQLDAIISHPDAPEWFSRIVSFCRIVLFRRTDLVGVERTDVDTRARTLRVEISKTMNYAEPIYIEIELPDAAWEIARQSLADRMHTPYLFWYRPNARNREKLLAKPHWTYITPQYLSDKFREIRDATGLWEGVDRNMRPSLHEVRGLGSRELRDTGVDGKVIQQLMGHSRKKTTQIYLDDGKPVYRRLSLRVG